MLNMIIRFFRKRILYKITMIKQQRYEESSKFKVIKLTKFGIWMRVIIFVRLNVMQCLLQRILLTAGQLTRAWLPSEPAVKGLKLCIRLIYQW